MAIRAKYLLQVHPLVISFDIHDPAYEKAKERVIG